MNTTVQAHDPRWIPMGLPNTYRWHNDYGVSSYFARPANEEMTEWVVICERVDAGKRKVLGVYRNLTETSVAAVRRDVEASTWQNEWTEAN